MRYFNIHSIPKFFFTKHQSHTCVDRRRLRQKWFIARRVPLLWRLEISLFIHSVAKKFRWSVFIMSLVCFSEINMFKRIECEKVSGLRNRKCPLSTARSRASNARCIYYNVYFCGFYLFVFFFMIWTLKCRRLTEILYTIRSSNVQNADLKSKL